MTRTSYYAGINKRFVAILIDGILLSLLYFIALGKSPSLEDNPERFIVYSILTIPLQWIYFAGMESSDLQGTFGKRVLGIIVTGTNGNKISFWQATGRYFAKSIYLLIWIVAGFIGGMGSVTGGDDSPYWVVAGLIAIIGFLVLVIGYLMAGFTPEKQALHDILARCLVVNGNSQSATIPWKVLVGLVVVAILSREVLAQIPVTSVSQDNSNQETTEIPSGNTTPPVTSTPTDTPTPESSNTGDNGTIPTSGRFTICGSEEQLIEPGNNNIDGDWKLEFSAGATVHVARLQMKGDSGIMRVIFPDSSGDESKVSKVDQTMQLYTSSQGLVLLGFNPVNPDNGESVPYNSDNFLIKQELDSSFTLLNCDDGGNRSPVKIEPFIESQ